MDVDADTESDDDDNDDDPNPKRLQTETLIDADQRGVHWGDRREETARCYWVQMVDALIFQFIMTSQKSQYFLSLHLWVYVVETQ